MAGPMTGRPIQRGALFHERTRNRGAKLISLGDLHWRLKQTHGSFLLVLSEHSTETEAIAERFGVGVTVEPVLHET